MFAWKGGGEGGTHDIAGTRHRCRNNRPGNRRASAEECSGHWHIETRQFCCSRFCFRSKRSSPIARRLRLPSSLYFLGFFVFVSVFVLFERNRRETERERENKKNPIQHSSIN